MDRGNVFSCMKYTLIICNVFGFILAIFNALFGIGYPQEKWPGGYTGGQMAIFSLFVMAFTTIGYCGAHHHKGYLLIVYGVIIFIYSIGNVVVWIIYNDESVIGAMNQYWIIIFATLAFLLLLFAFFMALKLRQKPSANDHASMFDIETLQRVDSGGNNQQRSNNFANIQTHPCPVPGCNYGKMMASS